MDKIFTLIKQYINRISTTKIPNKYLDSYIETTLLSNLSREKTFTLILIILNLLLILVDCFIYWNRRIDTPAYKNLFYLHVLALGFLIPYFYFFFNKRIIGGTLIKKYGQLIHLAIISFVLIWCVLIALNDQFIDGQITVYVIGIFGVSALLTLKPSEALIIYLLTYILFMPSLILIHSNPKALTGSIVNSTLLTVLAYMVSKVRYTSHMNNFMNERIIIEKSSELDNSHKDLESAIQKRTEELKKANELLIQEIKTRHKAELQVMQANLLYEEKTNELKRAIEYEKLRTAFFANISHELRTPLNLIFSAEQILERSLLNDEPTITVQKAGKYAKTIRQNCYRLIRIINNLIDITKIDAGYFEINFSNHNIVAIVEDITMSVVDYTKSKNIYLTFDTDIEEKFIACDVDKIERIVLNLLSNAIKFSHPNGNISVKLSCDNKYVSISVKDNGIGIPQDMQSAVFDKFVQVDNSITRANEGSGIGLSLVKSLVDMHGGQISLISEYGNGSEFVVKLPDILASNSSNDHEKVQVALSQNVERIHIEFSDIYMYN